MQISPIDAVANVYRKYVHFQHKETAFLLACWTATTYFPDVFDYTGYVVITSPGPECGKSILLQLLQQTTHNSTPPLVSPTEANIFRNASGKTQIIDEVDTWLNTAYLKPVLNAGFQRGATIERCEKRTIAGNESFTPKQFDIFAPRALAGIDLLKKLPKPTLSRSFIVEMEKRSYHERGVKFKLGVALEETKILQSQLLNWVEANSSAVGQQYLNRPYSELDSFGERTADISEPLLAVLKVAYPGESCTEPIQNVLKAIEIARGSEDSNRREQRLLQSIGRLLQFQDPVIGTSVEILGQMRSKELADDFTEADISGTLRRHGYTPASRRLGGGDPRKRYTITSSEFSGLVDRYGIPLAQTSVGLALREAM